MLFLPCQVCTKEAEWKAWYDSEAPELATFPCGYNKKLNEFGTLLLIRTWCPDRTLSQAKKFISGTVMKKKVYISKLTLPKNIA